MNNQKAIKVVGKFKLLGMKNARIIFFDFRRNCFK